MKELQIFKSKTPSPLLQGMPVEGIYTVVEDDVAARIDAEGLSISLRKAMDAIVVKTQKDVHLTQDAMRMYLRPYLGQRYEPHVNVWAEPYTNKIKIIPFILDLYNGDQIAIEEFLSDIQQGLIRVQEPVFPQEA